MGSFPSMHTAPEGKNYMPNDSPKRRSLLKSSHSIPEIQPPVTRVGSVCHTFLKEIPLGTLLSIPDGQKHFAAYCTRTAQDDVLNFYLFIRHKLEQLQIETTEPENNDIERFKIFDASLHRVISTTRLSNKTNAALRVSCNNGGQFETLELHEIEMELLGTLTDNEYQAWLLSQEGRDFMSDTVKFDQLIHDQIATCYFHQFLVQEYSSENLEFIESVMRYQETWQGIEGEKSPQAQTQENVHHASQLLKLFVEENAPLQINVPSKIRLRLERKVSKDAEAPRDIFRAAKGEIISLVQRDSWPRFTKSVWWGSYLNFDLAANQHAASDKFRSKRNELYMEYIGDDDLQSILNSELGQEYFRIYLSIMETKIDGSVDFLLSIGSLNNCPTDEDKINLEKKIVDMHLGENANLPALHVSPQIISEIKTNVNNQAPSLARLSSFNNAAKETEAYLSCRALPQFKMNGLYAKYRVLSQQSIHIPDNRPGAAARKNSRVY